MKILENLDLFNLKDTLIIVDDIERKEDAEFLEKIIEIKKQINGNVKKSVIKNVAFVL